MGAVQRHEVSYEVDAPPARVWRLFHPRTPPGAPVPRTFEHPGGTITILNEGDEKGQGLVRTCTFPVPKYLLSGGQARSWELVVEVREQEHARYQALGKPPWSVAEGSHSLQPLDGGERTRLTFVETFHIPNPVMRWLFERRVHRFISAQNSATYASVLGRLGTVTKVG
jgi:Polyketide cyclase / dehydrase and lipid transport